LKTKAVTSSFITGLSDLCLQTYEKSAASSQDDTSYRPHLSGKTQDLALIDQRPQLLDFELGRTFTLAAVGLLYSGPINHLWFAALEKLVRTQHQARAVMLKLAFDQVLFVPVAISGYMVARGLLERKSTQQIHTQLREKVPVAATAAWQFWPFANMIAFSMVPVMYRVLYGNVCAIFWNAKLSMISTQASTSDTALPSTEMQLGMSMDIPDILCRVELCTSRFDEMLPTCRSPSKDDGIRSEEFPATKVHPCVQWNYEEVLPTSGFDESWAMGSGSSRQGSKENGIDEVPVHWLQEPARGASQFHTIRC